jgi:cytochrome d ubiquinol oxidase subunit II
MNSIGPLWDGNEVWLVTFGGALFAAFPDAYATVFSGFYLAFMLLLFALIGRAVSMEFRSKCESPGGGGSGTTCFFAASFARDAAVRRGGGQRHDRVWPSTAPWRSGARFDLLNPYVSLVGLFTVAMFAMHGRSISTSRPRAILQRAHARLDVAHVRVLSRDVPAHHACTR